MSFSEWKEVKLGECIELIIDNRGKTPKKMGGDWTEKGIKTISAKNVHAGKLTDLDAIRYVDNSIYKKWMKVDLKKGDCLLVSEGATLGENMYWDSQEKVVLGQRLFGIRTNKNILDSKYFSAYMNTQQYQKEIDGRATGTSVLGIRQTELLNTRIMLRPIKEQIYIGDIYYNINKKIEINNEINKKLEKMAQLFFKQWFEEFEFSNQDGEPYKSREGEMIESEIGLIPKGWKVVSLGNYINIKHGYAFKSEFFSDEETKLILLTPGNLKIGGGFLEKKFKYYSLDGEVKDEYILNKNDLIVTMTDLSKDGDTLGYPASIPQINHKKLLHNQRLGKVENLNNILPKGFIYSLMCSRLYRHHILATATGTTVKHTAPKRIMDYKFALPEDLEIVYKYNSIIADFIEKSNNILSQNLCLNKMRNVLLPKLMSGEIRVPLD